jgi:AcrR family transcriptional regulator
VSTAPDTNEASSDAVLSTQPASQPATQSTAGHGTQRDSPSIPRGAGREAITVAAREVFAERGFHGASIRDIARRAGLSLSALYHWHSSKQDLLAALIEESGQDYFQTCDEAMSTAGDSPADRLHALVGATVQYRVRRRFESNIANQEWRNLDPEHQRRLEKQREPASQLWVDIVADGIAQGQFHCAYPEDARRTIQAACNAIAQWYDPVGEVGLPELVERYTAIAMRVVDYRTP